jgi:hypothetical protein
MPRFWILYHHKNRLGMMDIQGNGKAKLRREIVLNIHPILACIDTLVNATVVLLVQHIWLFRMLDQSV